MEQKRLFMSALGVGVGVGLGLASGQAINKWTGANSSPAEGLTADQIEQELRRLVVDGKDCKVTFDDFPYYLRITDGNTPPVKHRRNASVSSDMSSISLQSSFSTPAQKRGSGWSFDEKDFLKSLYKPAEGGDGIGSKPEAKSENPVSDSKPGTEKPVPLVKKDEIAAPKAPVSPAH
nr:nuclear valosin-containing protein-like [Ipomoea batatas]